MRFSLAALLLLILFIYHGCDFNAAQKTEAFESYCQIYLVADQDKQKGRYTSIAPVGETNSLDTPFPRRTFQFCDQAQIERSDDRSTARQFRVALHMVSSDERQTCQMLPQLWRNVDGSRRRIWQFVQVMVQIPPPSEPQSAAVASDTETQVTQAERKRQGEEGKESPPTQAASRWRSIDPDANTTRAESRQGGCTYSSNRAVVDAGSTVNDSSYASGDCRGPSTCRGGASRIQGD